MSTNKPEPKIGAGHLSAMGRLGLAELRAAVVSSESNIVQPSPYGIYGTKTPGEVQDEIKASARDSDSQSRSEIDTRLNERDVPGDVQDREPPQPERE